ncbi:unnamed protein product [Brachionus calyciflorus]|uniref:Transmembrane protein 214 n=1 Tax=Brachionus calyciflorus TaxID=104777 RepID=A0A813UXS1_9BILA|nr:unnamed protein product [Brachionus calyciflorus]
MTNTASANLGWEVAGGKKAGKKIDIKPKVQKKEVPKIEHAPPIRTDTTIYDLIRESDNDSDIDEINNNKKTKQVKQQPVVSEVKVESPKKATRTKEQKESLNLVNSSIQANQKKKIDVKPAKNPDTELENKLKDLKSEDFEKQLTQLTALFQNNTLTISENLVAYLNKELETVSDIDPLNTHENESSYPMLKLEKNVLKFLNGYFSKMKMSDAEKLFEYCLTSLFIDNQKVPATHGFKIAFQLIAKFNPNLLINLNKTNEVINANKHRHQRLLISLWALGQFGYYNLSNGIKIWFDSMLPQINVKGCSNFVITYLHNILQHHKVEANSKVDLVLNLDEYNRIYDLIHDKNLPKETSQKLKVSFDVLRDLFSQEMVKNSQNFEVLLSKLPSEKSPRQSDLLQVLVEVLLKNKESVLKWKQCYAKNLSQSVILLEEVNSHHLKEFKSLRDTRDVLRYFEEQSSHILDRLNPSHKESAHAKTHHFNRSKSSAKSGSEIDLMKKFNHLVKRINKENFKQVSIGSMVFKTLFYTVLAVSLFFYWDASYNKSIYTNSAKKQLEKYGLLEHTLKLIESAKQLALTIQKAVSHYALIGQNKFKEHVVPFALDAWKTTKTYTNTAWVNSEPYRNTIVIYYNEGIEYVRTNFPVVVKNLDSCLQLAVNYATTMFGLVFYYVSMGVEFVGVKLFGWKNGELEKVLLDGFKFGLDKLAHGFQLVTDYFNKL